MKEVSINMQAKLSEHFTLAELCKTSYITSDGNIPSRVARDSPPVIRSQSSLLTEGTVPVCHLTFPSLLRAGSGVRR